MSLAHTRPGPQEGLQRSRAPKAPTALVSMAGVFVPYVDARLTQGGALSACVHPENSIHSGIWGFLGPAGWEWDPTGPVSGDLRPG